MRLVLIGLVAGLFSSLFGVGGGIVIVPLLILTAAFEPEAGDGDLARRDRDHRARRGDALRVCAARSTSPTRCSSASRRWAARCFGTAFQQRLSGRALTLAFAALLAGARRLADRRMSTATVALALVLGLGAGVLSGLFGVGGGILFVPTLVALGLGQVEAAATSLLAIVPTASVGTWRQARYGNLRAKPALVLGVASIAGVEVGVPARHLAARARPAAAVRRRCSSAVAAQLAWRALREPRKLP